MKKTFCVFIALLTIIAFFVTGCGAANAPQTTEGSSAQTASQTVQQSSSEASQPEEYELPIVKDGSVTLKIATFDNWYTPASYANNLPVFEEIQKNTGIKIEWELSTPDEADTVIQTRLAAGSNLPDITYIPWVSGIGSDPGKFGRDGVIIPLEDLIAKNAPNITKFFNSRKDLYSSMAAPDGHIYGLSYVFDAAEGKPEPSEFSTTCFSVREDWMKKLNLQDPTNLDEWYNVLKAFKAGDPNGNGQADEIPLVTQARIWTLGWFGDAFGMHLYYSEGYYPDANGKVQYEWIDPRMKELVKWFNKLYTEGLLDPEFLTVSGEQYTSKINRNLVGSALVQFHTASSFNQTLQKSGIADAHYKMMLPPNGPDGTKGIYDLRQPIGDNYAITKDCKNPDIAIKFFDYIYAHEEGRRIMNFGIEGKSYTMADGKPQLTDWVLHNPDGLSAEDSVRSLGAHANIALLRDNSFYEQTMNDPEFNDFLVKIKDYTQPGYPVILGTAEESETLNSLVADINTLRDESLSNFILGKDSLDNWDQYVQKMKDLKIDDVLAVKQAQYDRYMSQNKQ